MKTWVTNLSLNLLIFVREEEKRFFKETLTVFNHDVLFVDSFKDVLNTFETADLLIMDASWLNEPLILEQLEGLSFSSLKGLCLLSETTNAVLPPISAHFVCDMLYYPLQKHLLTHQLGILIGLITRDRHLKQQEDQLSVYHELLIEEQKFAENIFLEFVKTDKIQIPQVHFYLSPYSTYNGDIFLAYQNEQGVITAMLGDFTGHGLCAAIGSIPTADTFYTMCEKNKSLTEIVTEINLQLHRLLPSHLFCAAALFSYNPETRVLSVWQGGLPTGYLLDETGYLIELVSKNLPLGILKSEEFSEDLATYQLTGSATVTFFTDGFSELKNKDQKQLGAKEIIDCLRSAPAHEQLQWLKSLLVRHRQRLENSDDIAIVNMYCEVL